MSHNVCVDVYLLSVNVGAHEPEVRRLILASMNDQDDLPVTLAKVATILEDFVNLSLQVPELDTHSFAEASVLKGARVWLILDVGAALVDVEIYVGMAGAEVFVLRCSASFGTDEEVPGVELVEILVTVITRDRCGDFLGVQRCESDFSDDTPAVDLHGLEVDGKEYNVLVARVRRDCGFDAGAGGWKR
jgi:hypothetical protein